jgi:hypothetical protein
MSKYLLLRYAPDGDADARAERWAELSEWEKVTESLREAAMLISNNALRPVETATTVRVRDGDVEITDGPFAVTKEILAGYYLLDCADLDEALAQAARLPTVRYGCVEVRPVVEFVTADPGGPAADL